MINWKPLSTVEEEQKKLPENDYLIYTDGQDVRYVTYDAIYNNFYYQTSSGTVGINPRHVTHYATIKTPDAPDPEYINRNKLIIELFVYNSNGYDPSLRGVNGEFHYGHNLLDFLKDFEDDPPYMVDVIKAIEIKYGFENETMYTVFVEMDWEDGEYGEYGYQHSAGYFFISKVLHVEKHNMEDIYE